MGIYLLPLKHQAGRGGTVRREIHQNGKHSSNHTPRNLPQGNNQRCAQIYVQECAYRAAYTVKYWKALCAQQWEHGKLRDILEWNIM